MPKPADFERRIGRIDELVREIETGADPAMRATAQDLVQSLMDLHGAGLERMVAIIQAAGYPARVIMEQFAADDLVPSLLSLYGLHPVDVQTRVLRALEKARPHLKSHGGNVELVTVEDDGTVRLLMKGTCHGCPSSSVTLKLAIEGAIREAAPEVTEIVIDNEHEPRDPTIPLVALECPSEMVQLGAASGAR